MNINQKKILTMASVILLLMTIMFFKAGTAQAIHGPDDDPAAAYKTKCQMCHTPKVAKFFDETKSDEVLADVVLKGKKTEKPPFMPEFASKGMTLEQAKAMVAFMKQLKKQSSAAANTNTTANTK